MARRQGGRIASYLTEEQRSHAGWIGASKCEVIFERALSASKSYRPGSGYWTNKIHKTIWHNEKTYIQLAFSPTFAAPIFPLLLSRLGLYNSCLFIKNSAILRYYNNQETTR